MESEEVGCCEGFGYGEEYSWEFCCYGEVKGSGEKVKVCEEVLLCSEGE